MSVRRVTTQRCERLLRSRPGRLDGGAAAPQTRACRTPSRVRQRPPSRPSRDPCCSLEDMAMRNLDFAPLSRSTIGFDRMLQLFEDAARLGEPENSYPPYNIEKLGEDSYRITMA